MWVHLAHLRGTRRQARMMGLKIVKNAMWLRDHAPHSCVRRVDSTCNHASALDLKSMDFINRICWISLTCLCARDCAFEEKWPDFSSAGVAARICASSKATEMLDDVYIRPLFPVCTLFIFGYFFSFSIPYLIAVVCRGASDHRITKMLTLDLNDFNFKVCSLLSKLRFYYALPSNTRKIVFAHHLCASCSGA